MKPRRRSPGTIRGMKKKNGNTQNRLTPNQFGVKVQNVHEIVHRRVKEWKVSAYMLAKMARKAGGTMTEQTVRNFLAGGNIKSNHLLVLLAVLNLEIRPKE